MERHLEHAPITEALIDIQVEPKPGLAFADVQEAFGDPDFGYYVKNPISEGTFAFGMFSDGQPIPPTTASAIVGLRLHSPDEKYVLQIRPNRLTLSRLPPYENWATLVGEAKRLWELFIAKLSPKLVVRIAARYINNLQLPMHTGDSFQDYIVNLVDVPGGAPQAVEAFQQRFQLYDHPSGTRVILTLTLDGLAPQGIAPVILDVDVFKITSANPIDPGIWGVLEKIKELKNRCFFSTLTEKALECYE
jgi:uncharacterized protein (TIGR04255 family)